MGLDMWLNKKTYIGNGWKEPKEQVKIEVEGIKQERVSTITERVGYWRKANAIHAWIVENVQEGNDNCKEWYMGTSQIEELLKLVKIVLASSKLVKGKLYNGYTFIKGKKKINWTDGKNIENPAVAKELLPVAEGFFFGDSDEDTAYNEYYVANLKETKKILEAALKEDGDYYYEASW